MTGLQFYSLITTLLLPKYKLLAILWTPGTKHVSSVYREMGLRSNRGARLADTAEEPPGHKYTKCMQEPRLGQL